jgi:NADPH:quinone reductase-like Zn-dependent oxidoreductase
MSADPGPNRMRAIRVHAFGGPDQLKLELVPRPEPHAGQVLLRILSAAVNPTDWKHRMGASQAYDPVVFPWTPGIDAAGIVESVGPGVSTLSAGQAVYGRPMASYAEYAAAEEGALSPKPANLDFDEAAAVPVGALTAWMSLFDVAGLEAGQRVLIQGAAGGVGLFAVQLARWKGARVIGAASAGNLDFVRSLGAEQALDYNAAPVESVVHDVDVVFDTVGGEVTARSLSALRKGGILVTVAGLVPEERAAELGIRAVRGGRAAQEVLPRITGLIEAGKLKPLVGRVYPLAEAAQAQAESQAGHGRGRIILKVAEA